MTSHIHWFTTYQCTEYGEMLMRNDAACEVVGIGTVQIKTHNWVVQTLTGVGHVSKLRRNPISLSALDKFGY